MLTEFSGLSAQSLLSWCVCQDGLAEVVELPMCYLNALYLLLHLKGLC